MLYGVGYDLCGIARIQKSLARPAFAARVFGTEERQLLDRLPPARRAATAAANFAAKEAFLKAAGLGLGGFALADVQCIRLDSGAPALQCTGEAAAWLRANGLRALVSLTHEAGLAGAFVVLEQAPQEGFEENSSVL